MVRLSHFDVRDQVPACAEVLDVWHGDHQVIEGGALGLLSLAELLGGAVTREHWKTSSGWCKCSRLTSSASGQLLISRP